MEDFEIIGYILLTLLGVAVSFLIRYIAAIPLMLANTLFDFLSTPLRSLYESVSGGVRQITPRFMAHPRFAGGLRPLILFLGATVFVVLRSLNCWKETADLYQVFEPLIFNTTVGSVFSLALEGFSFSPETLVCTGFSAFLASLFLRNTDDTHDVVWVIYSIVFICAGALICGYLEEGLAYVAARGTTLWTDLSATLTGQTPTTFLSVLGAIWNGIRLLVLSYFAILLLLIVVGEYAAVIRYGYVCLMIAMAGFCILAIFFTEPIPEGTFDWQALLAVAALVTTIVVSEYQQRDDREVSPN